MSIPKFQDKVKNDKMDINYISMDSENNIDNYALYILSGLIVYILITYFSHGAITNELFILLVFSVFSIYINNVK